VRLGYRIPALQLAIERGEGVGPRRRLTIIGVVLRALPAASGVRVRFLLEVRAPVASEAGIGDALGHINPATLAPFELRFRRTDRHGLGLLGRGRPAAREQMAGRENDYGEEHVTNVNQGSLPFPSTQTVVLTVCRTDRRRRQRGL